MKPFAKHTLAAAAVLACTSLAWANDAQHPSASAQASVPAAGMADGEIKKVDKDAGKLTIKHGPLPNLDMPGMTMVFRVGDPAMLGQVKSGDKVKFVADKVNGALTVTQIEAVK